MFSFSITFLSSSFLRLSSASRSLSRSRDFVLLSLFSTTFLSFSLVEIAVLSFSYFFLLFFLFVFELFERHLSLFSGCLIRFDNCSLEFLVFAACFHSVKL